MLFVTTFSEDEHVSIALALNKSQWKAVNTDVHTLGQTHKTIDLLTDYDAKQWVCERNPVVVGFLEGAVRGA